MYSILYSMPTGWEGLQCCTSNARLLTWLVLWSGARQGVAERSSGAAGRQPERVGRVHAAEGERSAGKTDARQHHPPGSATDPHRGTAAGVRGHLPPNHPILPPVIQSSDAPPLRPAPSWQ